MKRTAVVALRRLGLLALARSLHRGQAAILTYHGVLPGDDDRPDFLNHNFVCEATFDRQLRYLRQHYHPISLPELVSFYERRSVPPPHSVAITFDDGFANNCEVAFPLLRRHGIPFTVFLTSGLVGDPRAQLWTERVKRAVYLHPNSSVSFTLLGRPFTCGLTSPAARASSARQVLSYLKRQPVAARDEAVNALESVCGKPPLRPEDAARYAFLDWNQARNMAAAGVVFGAHTVTHPILTTLDQASLDRELQESQRTISRELRTACDLFAYPNGSPADYGSREKQALARAGFRAAFSLNGRLNGANPDPFEIDRINVGRELDPPMFEAALSGVLSAARGLRRAVSQKPHAPAGAPA